MSIEASIKRLFAKISVAPNIGPSPLQNPRFDPKINCGACYMKLIPANGNGPAAETCFYTCDFTNGRTAKQECDRVAEIAKGQGRLVGSPNFVVGQKCR